MSNQTVFNELLIMLGYWDYEALKRAIGSYMTDEEIQQMVKTLDRDGNGQIDYHEFLHHWKLISINNATKSWSKIRNTYKFIGRLKNKIAPKERTDEAIVNVIENTTTSMNNNSSQSTTTTSATITVSSITSSNENIEKSERKDILMNKKQRLNNDEQ